ncbi:MAG: hypothetical protein AAGJ83_15530, partial [Planctomycetota bacterium]
LHPDLEIVTMKMNRMALSVLVLSMLVLGCGSDPPPEITDDVAAQIAAEDQEVVDSESEL